MQFPPVLAILSDFCAFGSYSIYEELTGCYSTVLGAWLNPKILQFCSILPSKIGSPFDMLVTRLKNFRQ